MRISEAANMTGLSVSNIRFYEKKGLLAPAREEESKYRDYSEEDIARLKTILLYRKVNLPIETIYLLVREEVSAETVLKRQEAELEAQREMLAGSIDLCRRLLKEEDMHNLDADYYLNYVREEEEKGQRFAEAEELLDDFSEFAGFSPLNPDFGVFFCNNRRRRGFSLIFSAACLLLPAAEIAASISSHGFVWTRSVIFWLVWFGGFWTAFFLFRRRKNASGSGKQNRNHTGKAQEGWR